MQYDSPHHCSSLSPTPDTAFPLEIIELILFHLWHSSSMTSDERVSLMLAVPLVNKTFLLSYFRISSQDVYIPCASYAQKFLHDLVEGPSFLPLLLQSMASPPQLNQKHFLATYPDQYCRSITFMRDNQRNKTMGEVLSDTLNMISAMLTAPNLRHLCIDLADLVAFDDIFDEYRLVSVPPQITELCVTCSSVPRYISEKEITYFPGLKSGDFSGREEQIPVYGPAIDMEEMIELLGLGEETSPVRRWEVPSVKRLEIRGVGMLGAIDMMMACPNMEEVLIGTTKADLLDGMEFLSLMARRPRMIGLDIEEDGSLGRWEEIAALLSSEHEEKPNVVFKARRSSSISFPTLQEDSHTNGSEGVAKVVVVYI